VGQRHRAIVAKRSRYWGKDCGSKVQSYCNQESKVLREGLWVRGTELLWPREQGTEGRTVSQRYRDNVVQRARYWGKDCGSEVQSYRCQKIKVLREGLWVRGTELSLPKDQGIEGRTVGHRNRGITKKSRYGERTVV
jgi:hypothetical protein